MMTETSTSCDMLLDLLKRLFYATGALDIYHRWRNADTLTVVMLHRVLNPEDPRWAGSYPDYTLSTENLENCLRFLTRHYNIVALAAVQDAQRGGHKLPACALLITFDDGWADTAEHALPLLRKHKLPALVFVAADAIDRAEAFFQERLFSAWRRGRLSIDQIASALQSTGGSPALDPAAFGGERGLRQLITQVEQLAAPARTAVLDQLETCLEDCAQHMVSGEQLRRLVQAGVDVGVHGKTHQPLTQVADLEPELDGARQAVAAHLTNQPAPTTMSFPHGRFDRSVVQRAHAAGFDLLFSSEPVINSTRRGMARRLGRLALDTALLADNQGRFRPERLALGLFRRQHRRLL